MPAPLPSLDIAWRQSLNIFLTDTRVCDNQSAPLYAPGRLGFEPPSYVMVFVCSCSEAVTGFESPLAE